MKSMRKILDYNRKKKLYKMK